MSRRLQQLKLLFPSDLWKPKLVWGPQRNGRPGSSSAACSFSALASMSNHIVYGSMNGDKNYLPITGLKPGYQLRFSGRFCSLASGGRPPCAYLYHSWQGFTLCVGGRFWPLLPSTRSLSGKSSVPASLVPVRSCKQNPRVAATVAHLGCLPVGHMQTNMRQDALQAIVW
ncbi:hypothetical protein F5B22DRAFT_295169 [Xylaria bambusicola]|uniref:uncharacterized protein n=1 Tax=Xylaria bambusicola TaxID=326684 RepID=UPI0020081E52|nr:uncharacterized protein F5B22DRAFT_295169 [Xylaria bambusicola]KAI0512808.1 hypothetical protein F5B22DRAFT_295169 [Xylaria bambusicola]